MRDFSYAAARNTAEAIEALRTSGTTAIAGGTELLNWMRLGISDPERLIDIGRIAGLDTIDVDRDHLVIGSLATLNAIGASDAVIQYAAVLARNPRGSSRPSRICRPTSKGCTLAQLRRDASPARTRASGSGLET